MTDNQVQFIDEHGKPFEVPLDGSLGLLAMGYVGLRAWRQKRKDSGYDLVEIKRKEWEELQAKFEEKKKAFEEKKKAAKAKKEN